jgi:uncharacterized phage infection (PIP) family protein YhgE
MKTDAPGVSVDPLLVAAVDELLDAAEEELRGWQALRQQASDIAQRLQVLETPLRSTALTLANAVIPDEQEVAVQHSTADQPDLQSAVDRLTALLARISSKLEELEMGTPEVSMQQCEAAAAGLAETLELELTELSEEISVTGSALVDEMPARLDAAMQSLSTEISTLGDTSRHEMAAEVVQSLEEYSQSLSQVVETSCGTLEATAEGIGEEVESIVRAATDEIDGLGVRWYQGMSDLMSTYRTLGDDIKVLGEDISTTYSLVVEGMNTAGVGAHSASEALSDVQALLNTVS